VMAKVMRQVDPIHRACFSRNFSQSATTKRNLLVSYTLIRHGDRSPLFIPEIPESDAFETELKYWTDAVPGEAYLSGLDRVCPMTASARHRAPLYQSQGPLGQLTLVGMSQLMSAGRKMGARLSDARVDATQCWWGAVSSNFTRTRQSAQCFFKGLRHADTRAAPGIEVDIESSEDPFINVWEHTPEMQRIADEYMNSSEFASMEQEDRVAAAKEALLLHVPAFADDPAQWRWSRSLDYVTTRRAHSRPLHAGIEEHSEVILDHVAARANKWFSDPRFISMAGMPLIRRFIKDSEAAMAHPGDRPRIRVCTGHDISVMPVMHALVPPEDRASISWPAYAAELRLDLVEEDGRAFVEVFSNDEPLRVRAPQVQGQISLDHFTQAMEDAEECREMAPAAV